MSKNLNMKTRSSTQAAAIPVSCCVFITAALTGCSTVSGPNLSQYEEAERIANNHLVKFDALDFDVYTHQKWDRFRESHAADILVHYPDGHTSKGLEKHIEELKPMFVFAPDTRIEVHPVKIASGEWTSVIGVIQGTFTQPMPMPDGKAMPPTGKKFKFQMCTVGHWIHGVMDEEYLFWDNQEFMKQVGLAP